MRVTLPYGTGSIEVEAPDDAVVLRGDGPRPPADAGTALREALARPASGRALDELAGPDDDVAVVFSPRTPPRLNAVLASELLRGLESAGVRRDRITLIVGWDAERSASASDPIGLLGQSYQVVEHDPRDPDALIFQRRYPGERRGGLYLNAAWQRASVRVVTGVAAPHFAGGWTHALSVLPGLSGAHNALRTLSVARLLHPESRAGVGAGNPIFEEAMAAGAEAGVDLCCWLGVDETGAATGVWAGSWEESVRAAIAGVRPSVVAATPKLFDVVVVGAPGASALAQAIPALASAARAIKQGGAIVLAAELAGGLGSEAFTKSVTRAGTADALWSALLEPGVAVADQWFALHLAMARRKAGTVHVCSTLDGPSVRAMLCAPTSDVRTTLGELATSHQFLHGVPPRVGVIADGAGVLVEVEQSLP